MGTPTRRMPEVITILEDSNVRGSISVSAAIISVFAKWGLGTLVNFAHFISSKKLLLHESAEAFLQFCL